MFINKKKVYNKKWGGGLYTTIIHDHKREKVKGKDRV